MPGPARYWTAERIILALQEWAAEHGRPPVSADWRQATTRTPSVSSVRAVFGTWNTAVRAAGFRPRSSRLYWTRTRIIAAAQAWQAAHGVPPRPDEWVTAGTDTPSYATVYYHFGTWPRMLQAARLPIPGRRRWTDDRIAAAILDHLLHTGAWPTALQWSRAANGADRPGASTVLKAFGTWTAAKRYAGWDEGRSTLRERACHGCGCELDDFTSGCQTCSNRRQIRRRRERAEVRTLENEKRNGRRTKLALAGRLAEIEPGPTPRVLSREGAPVHTRGGEADAPAARKEAA